MDANSVFGEVLEKAGTAAKQTGKAAVNAVSDTAQATVSQIVGSQGDSVSPSDVDTKDVVEGLYEKSQTQSSAVGQSAAPKTPSDNSKSPQDQANIEAVRKELHAAYYQSVVNPPKREEERAAEKVEREEKEEMVDLQQKQMEKPPPLVQRQAQRVEKFPGASG